MDIWKRATRTIHSTGTCTHQEKKLANEGGQYFQKRSRTFIISSLSKLDQAKPSVAGSTFAEPDPNAALYDSKKRKVSLRSSSHLAEQIPDPQLRKIYHWITRSVSPSLGGK
jgi:hypothetical protein